MDAPTLTSGKPRPATFGRAIDLSMVRLPTSVSVSQSASSLPAAQLVPGPRTTTTFGSSVVPFGNAVLSVTEKVSTTDAPGAIDGMVQERVGDPKPQLLLQSAS